MTEIPRINPYYEPPFEGDPDVGTEIPSSAYIHKKQSVRLAEYHTGNKDTYLSYAEETELAELIQDGIKATDERAAIEDLEEYSPADLEQLKAVYDRIKKGREAKHKLVEANMRFAAYFARASVGIVDKESTQPKTISSTSDRYKGKNKKPSKKIGTYNDIRSNRSPHAQLEDRTQMAYIGLLAAADSFKPWEQTKQTAFSTWAAWKIQKAIDIYRPHEAPGWTLPVNILKNIKDYREKQTEDLEAFQSPTYDPDIEKIIQGTDTIPLDDLMFSAAPEEADEYEEGSNLRVSELLPDQDAYVEEIAMKRDLVRRLTEVLDTLSEREAGVIARRYGFPDDDIFTQDEIGEVYGVTKERIRQIESKTMGKMRHPSRADFVRDYLDQDDVKSSPYYSGDNIRTPHYPVSYAAQIGGRAVETTIELESWQVSATDNWDDPVRPGIIDYEDEEMIAYEVVEQGFGELLLNISAYHFQESFAKSVGSLYPTALIDKIDEIFGKSLKPAHIEKFWNTHLETFIDNIRQSVGDDFSYDRFGQLFAGLLRERMTEDDSITLNIPPIVDGKLTYVGAWQQYGSLRVNGNVGDHAAHMVSGLANVIIEGDAGNAVAAQTSGLASVYVTGSVKDMAGFEAGDKSSLVIDGYAGDFAGACAKNEANIIVHGNVGDYAACEINSASVVIEIDGDAGSSFGDQSTKGELFLSGSAISTSVHSDFRGKLLIGGVRVQ